MSKKKRITNFTTEIINQHNDTHYSPTAVKSSFLTSLYIETSSQEQVST